MNNYWGHCCVIRFLSLFVFSCCSSCCCFCFYCCSHLFFSSTNSQLHICMYMYVDYRKLIHFHRGFFIFLIITYACVCVYVWVDVSERVFRVYYVFSVCCVVVVVFSCMSVYYYIVCYCFFFCCCCRCFCFSLCFAISFQFAVTQGCISSAQMVALWTPTTGLQTMPQCHGVLPSKRARNSPLRGRGRPSRIVCTGSAMLDSDPCSKFSLRSMSLQIKAKYRMLISMLALSWLKNIDISIFKPLHRYFVLPYSPVWLTHLCSHRLRRPTHWPPP